MGFFYSVYWKPKIRKNINFFISPNWFQWSYFRVDTQLKWFRHDKWRAQQRQRVQVIFGSVQCSGTEVWHTHIVPELAHCCERLGSLSLPPRFSVQVWSATHPYGKSLPPQPLPSPSSQSSPPWLMCWLGPRSHLKGKNRISWVIAPLLFPEAWQWAKTSGFGIFPIPGSACPTCWKLNAIRRVRSSKWTLPKCYSSVSLMLRGRFIYERAEICLWRGSLRIDMVHSDINLKALAVVASYFSSLLIQSIMLECDRI